MRTYTMQFEGMWEEILTHADELAGRRVRLLVLPDEAAALAETAGGSTAKDLLEFAGKWKGDDLLDRLREVYETRTPVRF